MTKSLKTSLGDASIEISEEGFLTFANQDGNWTQNGPLMILNYYDRQHPRTQAVALPSDNSVAFGTAGTLSLSCTGSHEVEEVCPGILKVTGTFANARISLSFHIAIEEDGSGFRVVFSTDGIQEDHPKLYRVLSLEILPQFNAAITGEDGYMVLPNWSGIRMFFNKEVSREVRQTVYSSNDQWEHCCNMPVFGMHRDNSTMAGLITAGECDAQLVCRQHYELEHINSVHPEMMVRWQQHDDFIEGEREVRYSFAKADTHTGEAYVYIAKKYRDWLYEEKGLQTWSQKAETRPEAVGYRDRFMLKFFMGYKEPHPDGQGTYHATATFAQVKEILEDLLSEGVKNLCAILVGWNIDGHDGMPPTRFPVDERLGGEKAMRELVKWCEDKDIMLGIHDSHGASYPCSPEFDEADLIRHRSGEYWESVIWSGGQAHKICPSVMLKKYVRRDMEDVANLGVHGHHHLDAVGSFMPCYSEEHPLKLRSENIECFRKMFSTATEIMGSVSTEMPFGTYFDLIDGVYHCYKNPSAWHLASKAALFRDESIPLLNIAVHGSLKLCLSVKHFQSEDLLWGIAPQWEVSVDPAKHFGINTYEEAREKLIEVYKQTYSEDGFCLQTEDLLIDDFRINADGSPEVIFENGTKASLNNGMLTITKGVEND